MELEKKECPYLWNYARFDEGFCCNVEGSLKNAEYLEKCCYGNYNNCIGYQRFKERDNHA